MAPLPQIQRFIPCPLVLVALAYMAVSNFSAAANAHDVLIEAESFAQRGGWVLDTQFIHTMGSPYLLAHGLGTPVQDAETTITIPQAGKYRIFARTLDWVARWKAPGTPGRFQILINGQPLKTTFGTEGAEWHWQDGGIVELPAGTVRLSLHDLTGFDGRCDAIFLTTDLTASIPDSGDALASWRREKLNLPEQPEELGGYDLVVVGGGYAGMGAAISAARMGCKVALIQDRPVLGGNGSSEVRVWAQGLIRRGKYPRIGEIIEEIADHATKSPGRAEEFEDAKKESIVRAEKNIDLFLNHHADRVETQNNRIVAVEAFDTRTSRRKRFRGRLFADCTGHGTIGYLAGADWDMTPKGRMGMSNMWAWEELDRDVDFPETPWALDLHMGDFPYPRDHHGQWFWESGFDKDPIKEAEAIRDWNLRAVFGAFNAMKNREGRDEHRTARLTWVAYIGGPRESRRLMGDVVLTQEDIVNKRQFPDGCVPSTWSIDLHYPKEQYAKLYPDNPFISIAKHDRRIDRTYGYPIPYRCFYSRNIENMFMAGRDISVTHEALGTTRVMKTCGMMGEVVGKAASVCVKNYCNPRDVYEKHWDELAGLLKLPGKARRETPTSPIQMPTKLLPANPKGPPTGVDPATLPGIVIDDTEADVKGSWTNGTGLKGYVGYGYLYAPADSGAEIVFHAKPPKGRYVVRLAYQAHANRGKRVPVHIEAPDGKRQITINMSEPPPVDGKYYSLGTFQFSGDESIRITVGTRGAQGLAHADAVWLAPIK